MDILYFDNHLVVVNKPGGMTSQEGVEEEVKRWMRGQYEKQGEIFLHAAHRLDKPVSGVLVLAKTSKALKRLHEQFKAREQKKQYLALVEGVVKKDEALLEDFLVHDAYHAKIVSSSDPEAKQALLSYKVRERFKAHTLLEIDLHTGRYHQIRIQLSSRGHSIVNDRRYGAKVISGEEMIALHHEKLTLMHPTLKEEKTFQAPLPRNSAIWMALSAAPLSS